MTTHKMSDGQSEEGILHFFIGANGKLTFIPESKYKSLKVTLPPLSFAIKYPIKNLEDKKAKLPDL
jgi:hypothetical protein